MAAEISDRPRTQRRRAVGFNEAAANGRGNPPSPTTPSRRRAASMRPRRMAAEIGANRKLQDLLDKASMRPRRMAAEISSGRGRCPPGSSRFNEAAANGRGNRGA